MTEDKGLPVTRACSAVRLSRAAYYRAGINRAARDRPVIEPLNEIVAVELRWGFWKCLTACAISAGPGITSGCIAFTARCA
jgi:hypothetical protein